MACSANEIVKSLRIAELIEQLLEKRRKLFGHVRVLIYARHRPFHDSRPEGEPPRRADYLLLGRNLAPAGVHYSPNPCAHWGFPS